MADTVGVNIPSTQMSDFSAAIASAVAAGRPLVAKTTSGAIAVATAVVTLGSSGALSMTLAAPTAGTDDGKEITAIAVTAHAHTITTPANKIRTANATDDTVTFANAGDMVRLLAVNGVWQVIALLGASLSEV
jgi:hypothetical protein